MAKKAKAKPQKKPPQAQGPKKAVFTYYAEEIHAAETQAMIDRLNEIGSYGWELLFFSGNAAWFIGDSKAKVPPMVEHHEQHEEQPQS
jgi:hypothetical protein